MITAIVQFKVADGVSRDEVLTNMRNVAPRFEAVPSLIRKNFLFDEARRRRRRLYVGDARSGGRTLRRGRPLARSHS